MANVSRIANTFLLSWPVNPGKTYQVLYKDDLAQTDWKALGGSITVINSVASLTDIIAAGQAQRFYRIMEY